MNDERRAFEKSEPSEHYCIAVCQCPAIGEIGSPFSCPFGPSCDRPSVRPLTHSLIVKFSLYVHKWSCMPCLGLGQLCNCGYVVVAVEEFSFFINCHLNVIKL